MNAGARADQRHAPRPLLFAAIVAAHLLALWLLLRPGPVPRTEPDATLALFDIAPAPPVEPPPPPPPPPASKPAAPAVSGGGSPGVHRRRAAVRVEAPAPPIREAMDATLDALTLGPPPALAAGTAMLDLGTGGAQGQGTGSGAGRGPGDGDGRGSGGDADTFGRADWVRRPPDAAFRRNWPLGRSRLAQTVVVVLSCSVRRSGVPYRCRLRSEAPRGLGFAHTALMVMPEGRVRPVARNGAPLWDVPVLITVVFNAIEVAPPVPVTAAASAPLAR